MPIKKADPISRIGCLPCLLAVGKTRPCQIHHPFGRKGKRMQVVYGACPWHHQGHLDSGFDRQTMGGFFGPSLAWDSRTYRAFFGPESGLVTVQDYLLAKFESNPWMDYSTPQDIRRSATDLWLMSKHG